MATITIISFLLFTLLFSSSSILADDRNVLLSEDEFPKSGVVMSYKRNSLIMQDDCNLVLYHKNKMTFESHTSGEGANCTLKFEDGILYIMDGDGTIVWNSNRLGIPPGNYAAVLRPDGHVAVYGPQIWRQPPFGGSLHKQVNPVRNIPSVNNVLFSSQVLYDDSLFSSNGLDNELNMGRDCNLKLLTNYWGSGTGKKWETILWESGTRGNGDFCYLRLDHRGKLVIIDDHSKVIWTSGASGSQGEYVLIMEDSGHATVYGPIVWATNYSPLQAY